MGGKNYPKGGGKKISKKESIEGNKPNLNDSEQMSDQQSKAEAQLPKEQEALPKPGPSAWIKPNVSKQPSKASQGGVSDLTPDLNQRKESQTMGTGGPKGKLQQQPWNTHSEKEGAWSMPGPSSGHRSDASSEMVQRFGQQSLEPAKVESDSKPLAVEKSIKPKAMKAGPSKVSGIRGTPLGRIETNYVEIFTEKIIDHLYQYEVKITPVEDPTMKKKGAMQNREAPKKFRQQIFELFRRQNFPNVCMAYDGSNIAYCNIMPVSSMANKRNVFFMDPVTENTREYVVDISETDDADIPLNTLKKYATENEEVSPRALQALNTILKSAYQRVPNGILSGRSFYIPSERRLDLGDHFDLWLGLFQSVVLGNRVLLNVDITHKGFPKRYDSLAELWDIIEASEKDAYRPKDPKNVMAEHLNGLNIIYNQPGHPGTKKMYKFRGIHVKPREANFVDNNGNRKTIEDYFRQQYPKFSIRRPELPCIQLGQTGRVMVPMEFCAISDRQVTNKKYTETQTRNMINISATSTDIRKDRILQKMREINHNESDVLKKLHLTIDFKDFIKVNARCLSAPNIQYGQNKVARVMHGAWAQDRNPFLVPGMATTWAILILDKRVQMKDLKNLTKQISITSQSNRIELAAEPFKYEFGKEELLRKMSKIQGYYVKQNEKDRLKKEIKKELKDRMKYFGESNVRILFCIGPDSGSAYAFIKQVAEIEVSSGMLTQYLKGSTVLKKLNSSTIANILLKVNTKLNGINHSLVESPIMSDRAHKCMFIGADVSHPSPDQRTIPSVVGVVASHINNGVGYNPSWRLQGADDGQLRVVEIIQDFKNIMKEHLTFYRKQNDNNLPDKIFYYRDGVSESQYQHVMNTEKTAMFQACAEMKPGYEKHVQITIIIVQKRHHTRFFPGKNKFGNDKNNNVPPGTIVDTEIVRSNANEKHFFLASHQAIKGVTRPTKYSVILDDGNHDIDDIEQLTYYLCHLFARCNRSVSYSAPTYYAHLMAFRGRKYIEGEQLSPDMDQEWRNRAIKREIVDRHPMFFV